MSSKQFKSNQKQLNTITVFDIILPLILFSIFILIVYFAFLPIDFRPIPSSTIAKYPFGTEFEARMANPAAP